MKCNFSFIGRKKKIGKAESSLANKATERARQLEVRSEINGSFKDVVVALLLTQRD